MAKSYFHDGSDWRELVKGEQGERGPQGPIGPQGPAIDIETGLPISVDTTVGTRVYVGDTMIYGDTGWRDVTSLANGITAGSVFIRRADNRVYLKFDRIVFGDVSSTFRLLQLGTGFQPPLTERTIIPVSNLDSRKAVSIFSNGGVDFFGLSEGMEFRYEISFFTTSVWAHQLPGTPV